MHGLRWRLQVYERTNTPKAGKLLRVHRQRRASPMKVCVTGGTGFVGGHVVRELVEADHEVRVTFRDERRLERLAALQPEPVKADVLDRAAMRRAVKGCELLFHTAGIVASNPSEEVWRINALGPARGGRGRRGGGRAARGGDLQRGGHRARRPATSPGPRTTPIAAAGSG